MCGVGSGLHCLKFKYNRHNTSNYKIDKFIMGSERLLSVKRNNTDTTELSIGRRKFFKAAGFGISSGSIPTVSAMSEDGSSSQESKHESGHIVTIEETDKQELARVRVSEGENLMKYHKARGKIEKLSISSGYSIQEVNNMVETKSNGAIEVSNADGEVVVEDWDDFTRYHGSCPFYVYSNHYDAGITIEFEDYVNEYGKLAISTSVCFVAAKALPFIGEVLRAAIGCAFIGKYILDSTVGDMDTVTLSFLDESDVWDYGLGKLYTPRLEFGLSAGWKASVDEIDTLQTVQPDMLPQKWPIPSEASKGLHVELIQDIAE